MITDFTSTIIRKTLRVPQVGGRSLSVDTKTAIQLDNALLSAGFKADASLLSYVSTHSDPSFVAGQIIDAVRELIGDHVKHNVYFKKFPNEVPDTLDFWGSLIAKALFGDDENTKSKVLADLNSGTVNLLNLPGYGQYQHSYEEMLAAQDEFIGAMSDRVTLITLGDTYAIEVSDLFHSLVNSSIPLSDDDRELLADLAKRVTLVDSKLAIKIRENLAIVNDVRVREDLKLKLGTVTDALRFAAQYSGSDVTLSTKPRFKSLPRPVRRQVMIALNELVGGKPSVLSDVPQYAEVWKRLSERIHPGDFPQYKAAQRVFNVARGEEKVLSLAGKVEALIKNGSYADAARQLETAPGYFVRSIDRLLRAANYSTSSEILGAFERIVGNVSTKVLLSLREHVINRTEQSKARVFINTKGTTWVDADTRDSIDPRAVETIAAIIDVELINRVPDISLEIDPDFAKVAVPTSSKGVTEGFNILPRGSVTPIKENFLRFFCYWKDADKLPEDSLYRYYSTTDLDLSVLFLNEDFVTTGQVSYTNLRGVGATHSGDITTAPNGASEFIEIDLRNVDAKYIVPQVNVYSGPGFDELSESFFGYMTHTGAQKGRPFEAKTVRMKSEMRGKGRVALPLAFSKNEDGEWEAKWMHLFLNGYPRFNSTETNRVSTSLLARSIIERDYLTVDYLGTLFNGSETVVVGESTSGDEKVILPSNVAELVDLI